MEHLQRTGLVDLAATPHKRARERLREKAEWVLGSRRGARPAGFVDGAPERGARMQRVDERSEGNEDNAGRTSGFLTSSPAIASPAYRPPATPSHAILDLRTSSTRPRSISTSTTTSLASITSDAESETAEDAAVFSTLMAAFPRPPAIRVDGVTENVKLGEGALSLGKAFELREERKTARRPGPASISLPPVPPSSPSLRLPRPSSFSSRKPPLSPNISQPPSPSSRKPSTAVDKPLPPLPPPSIALPPTPPREASEWDVQHLLERFVWPGSPSRPRQSGSPEGSDEPAVDARFGRGRTASESSDDSDAESASDESLRMDNITAELSSLIDSFRPSTHSTTLHTPERPTSSSPSRAREKDGGRKVSIASSVVSGVSRASSAWSSSASGPRAGQENTTGGYRAYKLARKPSTSLVPSCSSSHSRLNRTQSSSSLASSSSSSSSGASSESEELFDLSLDSPPLERLRRERGWSWVAGRRKSSATSFETDGGPAAGSLVGAKFGGWARKAGEVEADEDKEVLRRSVELANDADGAARDSPTGAPARLRTLHTARSTPSLRRPSTLRPPSMVRRHSDWDIDRIDEEAQKAVVDETPRVAQVEDKSKGLRPLFTASAATSPSRLPSATTARTRPPTVPARMGRSSTMSPVKTRPLLTTTSRSMLRPPTARAKSSPALASRPAQQSTTSRATLTKGPSNLSLPAATSALPRPPASRLPLFSSSTASSIPPAAQKGLRRLSSLGTLAYIPSS